MVNACTESDAVSDPEPDETMEDAETSDAMEDEGTDDEHESTEEEPSEDESGEDGHRRCRLIVATTALEVGIEVPNVHLDVVIGTGFGLINIMQMLGRAGRRGGIAEGILISAPLRAFASNKVCRRKALVDFVHGESRPNCQMNEAYCDGCVVEINDGKLRKVLECATAGGSYHPEHLSVTDDDQVPSRL